MSCRASAGGVPACDSADSVLPIQPALPEPVEQLRCSMGLCAGKSGTTENHRLEGSGVAP